MSPATFVSMNYHGTVYNCRSIHTQTYYIYIDIDKILIALKTKNAGKVIKVKLKFY